MGCASSSDNVESIKPMKIETPKEPEPIPVKVEPKKVEEPPPPKEEPAVETRPQTPPQIDLPVK